MTTAPLLLVLLLGSGQAAVPSAPAATDTAGPLEFARMEGAVRERLSTCPLADDQRAHALELSSRAGQAIVKVYGITAGQLTQQIATGQKTAQTSTGKSTTSEPCEPKALQCLLRVLSDRDVGISELLGPPSSARPASWPTGATVACEGDPTEPPVSAAAAPTTAQP